MGTAIRGRLPGRSGIYVAPREQDARPRIYRAGKAVFHSSKVNLSGGWWPSDHAAFRDFQAQLRQVATVGAGGSNVRGEGLAPNPQPPHDSDDAATDDKAMTDLTREELDAKLDRTESRVDAAIARLETQFGELKSDVRYTYRMQQWTMGLVSLVVAMGVGGFVLMASLITSVEDRAADRMDRVEGRLEASQQRLEEQMNALPGELRGIADSITSAITAIQSGQPPVIVIERPAGPEATDQ